MFASCWNTSARSSRAARRTRWCTRSSRSSAQRIANAASASTRSTVRQDTSTYCSYLQCSTSMMLFRYQLCIRYTTSAINIMHFIFLLPIHITHFTSSEYVSHHFFFHQINSHSVLCRTVDISSSLSLLCSLSSMYCTRAEFDGSCLIVFYLTTPHALSRLIDLISISIFPNWEDFIKVFFSTVSDCSTLSLYGKNTVFVKSAFEYAIVLSLCINWLC